MWSFPPYFLARACLDRCLRPWLGPQAFLRWRRTRHAIGRASSSSMWAAPASPPQHDHEARNGLADDGADCVRRDPTTPLFPSSRPHFSGLNCATGPDPRYPSPSGGRNLLKFCGPVPPRLHPARLPSMLLRPPRALSSHGNLREIEPTPSKSNLGIRRRPNPLLPPLGGGGRCGWRHGVKRQSHDVDARRGWGE